MFVTFSDARHGYQAYAELNNYHMESFDLNIQIRVENEASYAFLFEEEIKDCVNSLSYFDNNLHRSISTTSTTSVEKEVKVAE